MVLTTELSSIVEMLSTSFVKRLMMSPVVLLSKYLTGSPSNLKNRSFLSFSMAFCVTWSMILFCAYVARQPQT